MENWAGGIHRREQVQNSVVIDNFNLCDRPCLPPRDITTINATRRANALTPPYRCGLRKIYPSRGELGHLFTS